MTTQQQTERDEALIAEVARAISRKVDSFGDTERTEQQRAELEWPRYREHAKAAIDLILARENWTPPAKPVDDEEPMVPRDVAESWKARADNLKEDRENLLSDLAIMMSKHVENWPEPKRFSTAIALLDKILSEALGKSLPEPAKPDRYLQVWKEAKDAYIYPNRTEHESDQVAAAVLRKHFAPPREVVEAARAVRKWYSGLSNPRLLADFILKGDV